MTTYPPEPWHLRGRLCASAFLVPATALDVDLPPDCSLVRVRGKLVIGAVWVDYRPGGVLSYRELMTTVLVRRGLRVLPTITHIWVDSEVSRDGGRALWGIPKGLAEFDFDGTHFAAHDGSGPIAEGTVRVIRGLPGRLPARFKIVQRLAGRAKVSRVRSTARIAFATASFDAAPEGPLAFLTGRHPFASFVLDDFRMSFGG